LADSEHVMRVAIVYPRANLDTVPSLVGAAELLAEHGCDVDVFAYTSAGQPPARFFSDRIHLRSLGVEGLAESTTVGLRNVVRRAGWLPPVARAPLARGYAVLGAGLAHGSRLVARARTRPKRYDCVVGVDPDGLELAASMAGDAPLAYYSLELLLADEVTTPAERRLKEREVELSHRAAFVIVQDEERGRLLAEDNGLPSDRLVLVPNSPPGPARRKSSRYWHARYGLAEDARVVLHAGSLGGWTGIEDLVGGVSEWPEPWVLVVHTRYDGETSPYVERLRQQADARRVHFSLKPVPRDEYDTLVDGAHVGLAFYVPSDESSFTQRNIQTIGLSSGKLAYYLRAGLPVVVNRASSIGSVIDAAGCGVAVQGAPQVGPALDRIQSRYDDFSHAACTFFDKHLDFRKSFEGVLERVDALVVRA
jgi:glycosyltransferase involved in cell wall biosynthesis